MCCRKRGGSQMESSTNTQQVNSIYNEEYIQRSNYFLLVIIAKIITEKRILFQRAICEYLKKKHPFLKDEDLIRKGDSRLE